MILKKYRKKTLYLHIGHYKTGTTALQVMLEESRARLRQAGLDYLEFGCLFSKHSDFAFSLLHEAGVTKLMHGYSKSTAPDEFWLGLFDAVRQSSRDTCLISTEEFMRIGSYPDAIKGLERVARLAGEDIDIRVIAYLRAPDAHLRSWYNQLVKMRVPVPGYNRTICDVVEPIHYDYAMALRPWIDIFGPEALILRPYEAEMRQGNTLYADFLSIFDIKADRVKLSLPTEDLNPRLDEDVLELTRLMQNAEFPEHTVAWARERASAYLRTEENTFHTHQDFASLIRRAEAGLAILAEVPDNRVDLDHFRDSLPQPQPLYGDALEKLLGLIVREMRHQQHRLTKAESELRERIEALEKGQTIKDRSARP